MVISAQASTRDLDPLPLASNFVPLSDPNATPVTSTGSGTTTGTKTKTTTDTGQGHTPTINRMGVGPGVGALSNEQATLMLNAPATLGGAQELTQKAETRGQELSSQFRQQAGAPIQYGQEQRDIISASLAPFAEGQEQSQKDAYEAARGVVNRSYEGPEGMDAKGTGEAIRGARTARDVSEAMGQGRAGVTQQNRGMDAATMERWHSQPGFAREALQSGARASDVRSNIIDQYGQSFETAAQRGREARQAGQEARTDIEGREGALSRAILKRAANKNDAIANANTIVDEFMESGNTEDLGADLHERLRTGASTLNDFRNEYVAIWSAPEFEAISHERDFVETIHYTGQRMYTPHPDTARDWENDSQYSELGLVFNNIGRHGDHSRPGRWLHALMYLANEQGQRGDQARDLMAKVQSMYARRQRIEPLVRLGNQDILQRGQSVQPGIMTPDQIHARQRRKGGYFSGHLRPSEGPRGKYAHLAGSERALGNDLRDYIIRPEGVATEETEQTEAERQQRVTMDRLLGGTGESVAAQGQPMEAGIRVDFDQLAEDEQALAAQGGERISEAESRWRATKNRLRGQFEREYKAADRDFWDYAGDFLEPFVNPLDGLENKASLAAAGAAVGGPVGAGAGYALGTGLTGYQNLTEFESDDYKRTPYYSPYGMPTMVDEDYWGIRG